MKVATVAVVLACAGFGSAFVAPGSKMVMTAEGGVSRRQAIQTGAATVTATGLAFLTNSVPARAEDGPYVLPDLPYAYEALEPHIDAATMKFHHDKHHLAYITNANKAVAGKDAVSILDLQKGAIKAGVRNAGGGHYNHSLFWTTLAPAADSGKPSAALTMAIDASFGSFDAMKEKFGAAAAGVFGSGWAWLGVTKDGKLDITTTPNQDNPLMEGAACTAMIPILGLDVWEHAYYLKYQNRRPEYIAAFWNVVNWAKVSEYYEQYALKQEGVPVQG